MRHRKEPLTEDLEDIADNPTKIEPEPFPTKLISSGSTLLNCGCSGTPNGAFKPGQIVTFPGGSVSGKTIMMLTILAECAGDKFFKDYDFYYDDCEESLAINIPYLFGDIVDHNNQHVDLTERILAPVMDGEEPVPSETIQDFKGTISNLCNPKKNKKPFIYIMDSLDSLSTDEEIEKEYKREIARAKSKEAVEALTGSYNTEKAKHIGIALRMVRSKLSKTQSVLFIVQQVRAKIGAMFGKQTTTSGGKAPYFYSFHQVWLTKTGTIPKTVDKIKYKIGTKTNAEITKNKLTGQIHEADFNIYYDYGIDDINSCIDFLLKSGCWTKSDEGLHCGDFGIIKRNDLVLQIDRDRAMGDLRAVVGKEWKRIEESMKLGRTRHFGEG